MRRLTRRSHRWWLAVVWRRPIRSRSALWRVSTDSRSLTLTWQSSSRESGDAVVPLVVGRAAEAGAARPEHRVAASDAPAHAGAFHPLPTTFLQPASMMPEPIGGPAARYATALWRTPRPRRRAGVGRPAPRRGGPPRASRTASSPTPWRGRRRCGHGRVETRTATVCHDVDWLQGATAGRASRPSARWSGSGAWTTPGPSTPATTCSAPSPPPSASAASSAPTGHREQPALGAPTCRLTKTRRRNRKGDSAACLAVIRRLALNIARMHPDKRSVRRKFILAQRSDDLLLEMIRCVRWE